MLFVTCYQLSGELNDTLTLRGLFFVRVFKRHPPLKKRGEFLCL